MKKRLVEFIRDYYNTNDFVPLHEPRFNNLEKDLVSETIESTFVSSVGEFVTRFEKDISQFVGVPKSVAVVNGTAALYVSLYQCGVRRNDLVITQALTFVATANAVEQLGAINVFVDISPKTLGMCPQALENYLLENASLNESGQCIHKKTGQQFKAVVPMHTFGFPVEIDKIVEICHRWNLSLVEDAAESLGSYYKGKHTGAFGRLGAFSFNGNKIITTGGGGMIVCNSTHDAEHIKHLTTTAKVPHPYKFFHDEPAFNYRMPNLNAALGCAQLNKLNKFIEQKRELAQNYRELLEASDLKFFIEPSDSKANYWLNTIICEDMNHRDEVLDYLNKNKIMSRPVWELMTTLPMYKHCEADELENSRWYADRIINIPSSVRKLDYER